MKWSPAPKPARSLSPVLDFGVPVLPACGALSYAQVAVAVAAPELALPFLVVQVLVVRGWLSLALQPVLVGAHTADVVAAGVVGPLWEVRPDVLHPDQGLRPTGVPALCRAAVVPDELKAELVQEATEGANPAPLRLVRGVRGHQDVSVVAGPHDKLDEEPARPSVVASGAVEACELVVLVAASHVLVVVGGEFRAGDPFLRAVLVAAVHPLDLPRVVAAREKVDAPLVHPHHGGEVVPALELDKPPLRQTAHD